MKISLHNTIKFLGGLLLFAPARTLVAATLGDSQALPQVNMLPIVNNPLSTLGIQNVNSYAFVYTGGADLDAECQDNVCFQTLWPQNATTPGGQQWVTLEEKQSWLVADYDVCEEVEYNVQGKAECKDYQGHVSITFTPQVTSVQAQSGTAVLGPYQAGKPFALTFTPAPIPPSPVFPTPSNYTSMPYRGINLAGCEFDSGPNCPAIADALYYVQRGMNTVRLPFKWEFLQPDLTRLIDFTSGYGKKIADLVQGYTDKGLLVIADMHNYMRYNKQIIGGQDSNATAQNYADAWASIAAQFKNNPNVFFDLMNEPNTMATELIVSNYNQAIPAIRTAGFNNTLLLEGNAWSGISNWEKNWYGTSNSLLFVPGNIDDPQNNWAINAHAYFTDPNGGGGGETECVNSSQVLEIEKIAAFTQLLSRQGLKAYVTELGGIATSNCVSVLNTVLTAFEQTQNIMGWVAWAGGQSWPADYVLNLNPNADGTEKIQMVQAFDRHLTPPNNLPIASSSSSTAAAQSSSSTGQDGPTKPEEKNNRTTIIVGSTIAAVAAVGLFGYCYQRRKNKNHQPQESSSEYVAIDEKNTFGYQV